MLAFQGRLIRRAIEIAGSPAALCRRLGVDEHALLFWMGGKARMPDSAFLACADLLLNDDIARAAQDRRGQPRSAANDGDGAPGPSAVGL